MKKFSLLFVVFFLFFSIGYLLFFSTTAASYEETVLSPVPSFLTFSENNQVSTLSLFLPSLENSAQKNGDAPQISAKSALIYDISDSRVLYQKDPTTRLPMASLTKIMTAIISLENKKSDDRYMVNQQALVGEDAMGVSKGEIFSLEELLYGLILHSGNDAAEALADNYPLGRGAFISAMNKKAQALGLSDTNFTNPTGLEGDGRQYTTAYDLLVMTRYALWNFPLFAKAAGTFSYDIPPASTHKEIYLENETNLLTSYPGVQGVKTGYTPEAGLCLVTYLVYKNHKIIGVLLGSDDRKGEMKELLDYSLKNIGITPPPHS